MASPNTRSSTRRSHRTPEKKAHSDCGNLQGPFIVSVERFLPFLFNDKIPCYPATGPAGIIKREGHAGR